MPFIILIDAIQLHPCPSLCPPLVSPMYAGVQYMRMNTFNDYTICAIGLSSTYFIILVQYMNEGGGGRPIFYELLMALYFF